MHSNELYTVKRTYNTMGNYFSASGKSIRTFIHSVVELFIFFKNLQQLNCLDRSRELDEFDYCVGLIEIKP